MDRPEHRDDVPGDGESRYRQLFESAGDAILILRDDRFVDCNLRTLEVFGCTREEIIGHPPYEYSPSRQPDGRDSTEKALERIRAAFGGEAQRFEWVHVRRDRTPFVAEVTLNLISLGSGPHLQAIVRDITERKRADEALRASEAHLRQILDNAPFGAHLYELRPGNQLVLTGANPAAERILRVDHAARLGRRIEEAFPKLAGTGLPEIYRRVALEGIRHDDLRLRYDEGAVRGVFEARAFQTGPGRMAVFFEDVSERLRAREALERSERKYRLLAENVADVIWTMDLEFRLTYVSPSIERMHGGTPAEWVGRGPEGYLAPASLAGARETLARELAEAGRAGADPDRTVTLELEQRRRDGSKFWTEVSARCVRDATGRPAGIIGVTRDISDRRRLEEQLAHSQRMESVGRLAGGVAHDLNNMLTPILGHAELLRLQLPADDPRRARLQEIAAAGERCRDLVQRLLAFARRQTFEIRPLDLNEVVRGFLGMLRRTLREDIAIELALDGAGAWIEGDRGQVEQVLMNLAVNAQDAMPGGGTLVFETAAEPSPATPGDDGGPSAGPVRLTVRDSGSGMPADLQDRIFEPFFTTKRPGQGTGLGLSIVYGIVEQHRATIEVESELGRGTAFHVRFPASTRTDDDPERTEDEPERAPGRGTVLVVEDEAPVRDLAVEVLRVAGYAVHEAADARGALALAERLDAPVDLLLTDVILPDENGRALDARLRARHPGLRTVFMSGYTADVIGRHGVLEPGVHFLQKPFAMRALAARVAEAMAQDPPAASPAPAAPGRAPADGGTAPRP